MLRCHAPLAICLFALLCIPSAFADKDPDGFQMGRDIHVAEDRTVGEATCINCSIYIRGKAAGDAFALNGDVVVESGGQLAGDVSTVHGDIRVADGAQIGGDVASIAGAVRKQAGGIIGGDVTALTGVGWLLLIILVPLAFLGAIVALIVWLVQRNRRPTPVGARAA